jgi:hypothetical protein
MALTIGTKAAYAGAAPGDPLFIDIVPVAFDNSYPTGGEAAEALIQAKIGPSRTILAVMQNGLNSGSAINVRWVRSTGKLMALDWAGAEIAGTTDLSSVTDLELVVISK